MKKLANTLAKSTMYAFLALVITSLTLPLSTIMASGGAPGYPSQPVPANSNYFVGSYYKNYTNYSQQFQAIKMNNLTANAANNGLTRKPLLGFYNGALPMTLDWQIKWALEHGLSYFVFEESWNYSEATPIEDDSVKAFLNARYMSQMSFAVKMNDIIVPTQNVSQINALRKNKLTGDIATYYKSNYLNKSNYLKVEGKPVIYLSKEVLSMYRFNNNAQELNSILSAFETSLGTEVFWVLTDPESPVADGASNVADNNLYFQFYKQVGFDAISPEYMAPVTNGYMGGRSQTGIDYYNGQTGFIDQEYRDNIMYMQRARDNGLKMILNAPINFDERPEEAYGNIISYGRGFTNNQSISRYELLLNQIRDLTTAVTFLNVNVNGKPMVGAGSWNDWSKDNHIEPGYSKINANGSWFDPLRAVGRSFATNFTNPNYDLQSVPNLRAQLPYNHTVFTKDTAFVMNTTRNSINDLSSSDVLYLENSNYFQVVTFEGGNPTLQAATNIDVIGHNSVDVVYSATCGTNNANQCFDQIRVKAYVNNCAGEIWGACDQTQQSGTYIVTSQINRSDCINKATDADWGTCTLPLSFQSSNSTYQRIEKLDISFVRGSQAGIAPIYLNVAKIEVK